jgi:hypothetical protein
MRQTSVLIVLITAVMKAVSQNLEQKCLCILAIKWWFWLYIITHFQLELLSGCTPQIKHTVE